MDNTIYREARLRAGKSLRLVVDQCPNLRVQAALSGKSPVVLLGEIERGKAKTSRVVIAELEECYGGFDGPPAEEVWLEKAGKEELVAEVKRLRALRKVEDQLATNQIRDLEQQLELSYLEYNELRDELLGKLKDAGALEFGEVGPADDLVCIMSLASVFVTQKEVDSWTQEQRQEAAEWAWTQHLLASDNIVPERAMPKFLEHCPTIQDVKLFSDGTQMLMLVDPDGRLTAKALEPERLPTHKEEPSPLPTQEQLDLIADCDSRLPQDLASAGYGEVYEHRRTLLKALERTSEALAAETSGHATALGALHRALKHEDENQ